MRWTVSLGGGVCRRVPASWGRQQQHDGADHGVGIAATNELRDTVTNTSSTSTLVAVPVLSDEEEAESVRQGIFAFVRSLGWDK